ncbi:uncharacterized protein LOC132755865 isoform X2 [Ruditapes philippinarum]|nr:uncharacterized protein LOC132755865 isoform X2 [Ruditapes philippinarum]
MNSKISKEYGSTICNIKTWIRRLFLIQGITLVVFGVHGLLTYTCPGVECFRLWNRSWLILALGCFYLICWNCYMLCKNVHTDYRVFILYVIFSCFFTALVFYQTATLNEYQQTFTSGVLFAIIMTGTYIVLIIVICCLCLVELCQTKKSDV